MALQQVPQQLALQDLVAVLPLEVQVKPSRAGSGRKRNKAPSDCKFNENNQLDIEFRKCYSIRTKFTAWKEVDPRIKLTSFPLKIPTTRQKTTSRDDKVVICRSNLRRYRKDELWQQM
jgi:hypothetical protein